VIAADGARSPVRHALGLRLQGDAYEGRYITADVKMRSDYPADRRAFFDPKSNPGQTILVHKQPDDIWRIDYQLDTDDDETEAVREERIRERVGSIIDMLGERQPWELEWWSLYKAYTLTLDDYRCGRTLFIGDAAHLVPIFGVRGLNSGLADAMNPGWKLAAVLNGDAPETLLNSYSTERRGATLEVFRNAGKSTRFMTPPTRGYALMREAVLSLSIHNAFTRALIDPRQSEPYTYVDSALTSYRHRDQEFAAGPRAGASLRNCRLGDDRFLLDYLGRGYTVLYFSGDGNIPDAVANTITGMNVCGAPARLLVVSVQQPECAKATWIPDSGGSVTQTYGAQHGSTYLVRPDRHVAARWLQFEPPEFERAFATSLARETVSPSEVTD
jgi:3-(3-hydroxy-phenyl)propionate hydroxylase